MEDQHFITFTFEDMCYSGFYKTPFHVIILRFTDAINDVIDQHKFLNLDENISERRKDSAAFIKKSISKTIDFDDEFSLKFSDIIETFFAALFNFSPFMGVAYGRNKRRRDYKISCSIFNTMLTAANDNNEKQILFIDVSAEFLHQLFKEENYKYERAAEHQNNIWDLEYKKVTLREDIFGISKIEFEYETAKDVEEIYERYYNMNNIDLVKHYLNQIYDKNNVSLNQYFFFGLGKKIKSANVKMRLI